MNLKRILAIVMVLLLIPVGFEPVVGLLRRML
jgi:hypothetical protein